MVVHMTKEERIREDQSQAEYIANWKIRRKYRAFILRMIKHNLMECVRLAKIYIKGR